MLYRLLCLFRRLLTPFRPRPCERCGEPAVGLYLPVRRVADAVVGSTIQVGRPTRLCKPCLEDR